MTKADIVNDIARKTGVEKVTNFSMHSFDILLKLL